PPLVFYRFGTADVDDLGGLGQHHVGPQDGFLLHTNPLDDDAAGADEAAVFDDHGRGLQGLQDPADAYASAEVHPFADLCAGTHRRPGVDHGPFVDISPDID